jgi:enhancing lycopene biosynthesis protein 2
VTTPAYMLANRISQVNEGISKCVREVIAMIG